MTLLPISEERINILNASTFEYTMLIIPRISITYMRRRHTYIIFVQRLRTPGKYAPLTNVIIPGVDTNVVREATQLLTT
jgi:hypothetical protein